MLAVGSPDQSLHRSRWSAIPYLTPPFSFWLSPKIYPGVSFLWQLILFLGGLWKKERRQERLQVGFSWKGLVIWDVRVGVLSFASVPSWGCWVVNIKTLLWIQSIWGVGFTLSACPVPPRWVPFCFKAFDFRVSEGGMGWWISSGFEVRPWFFSSLWCF